MKDRRIDLQFQRRPNSGRVPWSDKKRSPATCTSRGRSADRVCPPPPWSISGCAWWAAVRHLGRARGSATGSTSPLWRRRSSRGRIGVDSPSSAWISCKVVYYIYSMDRCVRHEQRVCKNNRLFEKNIRRIIIDECRRNIILNCSEKIFDE